jgi:hypothetical protein
MPGTLDQITVRGLDVGGKLRTAQQQETARRVELDGSDARGGELGERRDRGLELGRADAQQRHVIEHDRQCRRRQAAALERPLQRAARADVGREPELAEPLERPGRARAGVERHEALEGVAALAEAVALVGHRPEVRVAGRPAWPPLQHAPVESFRLVEAPRLARGVGLPDERVQGVRLRRASGGGRLGECLGGR